MNGDGGLLGGEGGTAGSEADASLHSQRKVTSLRDRASTDTAQTVCLYENRRVQYNVRP